MGSAKEISSATEDFFLNSLTLPMNFLGSLSNLPTQSMQQKPISCFSYSDVRPATMSLPVIGHFLLIGSSKNAISSTTEVFFLNSLTLPMNFLGSLSNFPTQSMQQNPISCFSYSEVRPATMSLPVSGHFLLMGSSKPHIAAAANAIGNAIVATNDSANTLFFIRSPPAIRLNLYPQSSVIWACGARGRPCSSSRP